MLSLNKEKIHKNRKTDGRFNAHPLLFHKAVWISEKIRVVLSLYRTKSKLCHFFQLFFYTTKQSCLLSSTVTADDTERPPLFMTYL